MRFKSHLWCELKLKRNAALWWLKVYVHEASFLHLLGPRPAVSSAGEQPELYGNGNAKWFYIQSNRKYYLLYQPDHKLWLLTLSGVKVSISSPDYVTVGVPASVKCDGECLACTYSMSLVGQSAQGQGDVLVFTVRHWVKALNVTCTATNVATNVVATATKQLQVLGMWSMHV